MTYEIVIFIVFSFLLIQNELCFLEDIRLNSFWFSLEIFFFALIFIEFGDLLFDVARTKSLGICLNCLAFLLTVLYNM